MPGKARPGKQKTLSSAKKRFKITGKGKVAHEKAAHNHLLQQKAKRQKRLSGRSIIVSGYTKAIRKFLLGK